MALNRYTTSSRFSPKTTDPITKARIADPEKIGRISPTGGSKITSWPEFREMYKEGKLSSDVLTGQTDLPEEITKYMEGGTDKLSEKYAEPEININPDTQEYAHYRAPTSTKWKAGDSYTSNPDDEGKLFASWMRLDAENKANESEVSRRRKKIKSQFGDDISIQGDTKGGVYTKEQMAGLYPDMQFAGGVSMSEFGQSSYTKSKAQLKEEKKIKDREIKIAKDLQGFEEGTNISRLPVGPARGDTYKATRKGGIPQIKPIKKPKGDIVGNEKTEGYVDPSRPSRVALSSKGFKGDRIKYEDRGESKISQRFSRAKEMAKYRKEGRLAKATYGRGLDKMTGEEIANRKQDIKEKKKEQRSVFKRDADTDKITGMHKLHLFKNIAMNKPLRNELQDIRKAEKYRKAVGGEIDLSLSDQSKLGHIKKKGSPKHFTPTVMKNYRSSLDNPLNRTSMWQSSKSFKR